MFAFKYIVKSEDEFVELIICPPSHCSTGYLPNSINISKSNITSSNESTGYTTESTHIHVNGKGKHKSSRHFTPKQQTIMQQPGRWIPWKRLQLVQQK
jgi:hypothetical protein